jgi:alpha-glucosidase
MPWTPGPGTGFTTGEPWLPVHPDADRVAVSVQDRDPASVLALYRALIALRRATPALRLGSYRAVDAAPDVYAYVREHEGRRVLVALNFAPLPRPLPEAARGGAVLLSTAAKPAGQELAGDEARIVDLD